VRYRGAGCLNINVLKNFISEIYDDEIIPPDFVPPIKLNICQYYF